MADISLEEEYVAFMLEDFPNPSSRSLPVTTVSGTTDNARSIFGVAHARLVKNEWTQLATSASITSGIASSLRLTSTGIPYVLVETSSHTASSYRSYQTSCVGSLPTTTGLDLLKSSAAFTLSQTQPNLFYYSRYSMRNSTLISLVFGSFIV
ncbi:hypothetical protein B0H13DRAFT_1909421 [Mycena leptocephala]|nr:hypothetical protein B0H13DRAFT_1909421 [Mycena leptocephala]